MRIFFFLIILSFTLILRAQNADVLIAEHPAALNLLDAYQRTVPPAEKSQWPNFAPFVLGPKQTLPDQVTTVQKVWLRQRPYFFILNDKGRPDGLEQCGYHRIFRHVKLLHDTVKIKEQKSVPLLHPQTRKAMGRINGGQMLTRVFEHGALYYVGTWNAPQKYGWCSAAYARFWTQLSRKDLLKENQWQDFIQQLNYFINRKNAIYLKLFQYFRQNTGVKDQRNIPRWNVEKRDGKIRLIFSRPDDLKRWKASTKVFTDELLNLCASFKFKLKQEKPGIFIITRE